MAKRGTLNQGMRMEWLMARLSLQINHALGGKAKFQDLVRHHDTPEATELDSPEAFAALFGARKQDGK